jgi:putative redox protein
MSRSDEVESSYSSPVSTQSPESWLVTHDAAPYNGERTLSERRFPSQFQIARLAKTMVTIQVEYQGDLHCKAVHGPSRAETNTDAPTDNQGRGEGFSPTDLVATALGTCMLTVMGIVAQNLKIDIAGATATIEKEMSSTAPRRIHSLTVRIHVPHSVSSENQQKLERAAHTCPVHRSLHPGIHTPTEFIWG